MGGSLGEYIGSPIGGSSEEMSGLDALVMLVVEAAERSSASR